MKRLFKNTAVISVLTLVSRILGVVRDAFIAMIFGTSTIADAFFVAFRPVDLLRKLFSEGILNVSFIPIFSNLLEAEGRKKAYDMVYSFFCFLSFAGVCITLVALIFAPLLMERLATDISTGSYEHYLSLTLFRIMVPYLWFIMMTALCMAVLHTLGDFAVPAFSPIVFNLVVIGFTIFSVSNFSIPIFGLAAGVTIGGVCQLVSQLFAVKKYGLLAIRRFSLKNPHAVKTIKIMLPGMIGSASYQINMVTASFYAIALVPGSISSLYFADRLVQFPMALFTISAVTVLLPELTAKAAKSNYHQVGQIFSNGLKIILFMTIPAMAGILALNEQIIALLFGRGQFGPQAIHQTAQCTFYLACGLWIFTVNRFFVTLFFSLRIVKVPFYSGIISIITNGLLSFWLISNQGLSGLILSVVFSSGLGLVYLMLNIPGQVKLESASILVSACRSVFVSVIMFVLVKTGAGWIPPWESHHVGFIGGTIACIGLGIGFYLGAGLIISSPELKMLLSRKQFNS